jgi:hypothetical protein
VSLTAPLTQPLAEALAEAEKLIATAGLIETEQDRLEGYRYLAGLLRSSLQLAFDRDPDRPVLVQSTHQYAKQGLDNPDAMYFHAFIDDQDEWVLRGVRGSTADLSFQIMSGGYSSGGVPQSLAAFDDRELDIAADGSFELRLNPAPPGARSLIVREVYNDWSAEERGRMWLERPSRLGHPAPAPDAELIAKQYRAAARGLISAIHTWFAFPQFFQNQEPVNALTPPRSTPGGLSSQRSSIGHYRLEPGQALIVTVPVCADCSYQGFQVGSHWYVSTDYETHQTSLTKAQAAIDPDGRMRFVVSEQDPGVANWVETTGHRAGPLMLRWQRLTRELTAADGPTTQVVEVDAVPDVLPYFERRAEDEWATRIAARQRGVARRMIS